MKQLVSSVVTLFVGRLPKAPGTWGSLVALLPWWFATECSHITQAVLIISAFTAGWVATFYYEKWNKTHDPKEVVVDELIGMWITLFGASQQLSVFVLGFLFFRLFDIWKPFPIGWIDKKMPGALGTILDDVVAGLFAFGLLQLSLYLGSDFEFFH